MTDLPRMAELFAHQSYKTNVNFTCIIKMIDFRLIFE